MKPDNLTTSLLWASNSFLLDSLYEQAPLGLCIVDEKLRFIKVSKYLALSINGKSVEEHVGRTVTQVFGKKAGAIFKPYFQHALQGEYLHDVHISIDTPSHSLDERHFLLTLYPLPKIKEGKLVGCLLQEVTKQFEDEEKIFSYQNRLEMAQAAGGVGVFEWNFDTNEVWSSPEEIELFELNVGSAEGKLEHWLNRIHPEDKARILDLIETSSEERQRFDTEFRIVLPNGQTKWIRGKGKFFYDKDNEVTKLIGVNYDVTKRKKEEDFLKFKADASRLLMSTADSKKVFQQVCKLAIQHVADWCSIDILDSETGIFRQEAVCHKDPKKTQWAIALRKKEPVTLKNNEGLAQVIETMQPLFVPQIDTSLPQFKKLNKKKKKALSELNLSSAIIVPLVIQGKAIGAITFVLAETQDYYTDDDLELMQQLAMRASLYLENTKLYETLKSEQERFTKLLENVPSMVFESRGHITNPGYITTFINAYAEELLGYPLKKWLTTPKFGIKLIHPEDKERVLAEARKVFDTGAKGLVRFRWRRKDRSYIWVEARYALITDNQGRALGLRGVINDISERMKLEQRKDNFIATASHELKTPLTSLKVFTQVIKSNPEIKKVAKLSQYLDRMDREVDRLTELVFDLLDLSKIQRGQLSIDKKDISIVELVQDMVQSLQPTLKHTLRLVSDDDAIVSADAHRLRQVFSNLISNAAKYSPQKKEIRISIQKDGQYVTVGVQDFGIGIAPQYKDHIFQRFFRVFDEADKTFPGLGMGLFISKTIVERHGGQIWVESQIQKGSTFFVRLPNVKLSKEEDE